MVTSFTVVMELGCRADVANPHFNFFFIQHTFWFHGARSHNRRRKHAISDKFGLEIRDDRSLDDSTREFEIGL